jgi:phage FluMu protein Com
MTSPARQIDVRCPRCQTVYTDWERGSVNLDLEGWDPEDPKVQAYLYECSHAICPVCKHVVDLDVLVVKNGVWYSR